MQEQFLDFSGKPTGYDTIVIGLFSRAKREYAVQRTRRTPYYVERKGDTMNSWDIDNAVERFRDQRVLGAAAQSLANLRDVVNANSDGWAYWEAPSRAAKRLMNLLEAAKRYNAEPVTRAKVRAAYTPIKSFLTRKGLTCTLIEP